MMRTGQSNDMRYLILPGWRGSPQNHWQSYWQRTLPNAVRVNQIDWERPGREPWVEALAGAVEADTRRCVLVAHSLGCITVAHWAARAPERWLRTVAGALLVAPADVERGDCVPVLKGFAPVPMAPLPFPSLLVGSDNDSAATPERAVALADAWGAESVILEGAGHINVASGHHRWLEGFEYLYRLEHRIGLPLRITRSGGR